MVNATHVITALAMGGVAAMLCHQCAARLPHWTWQSSLQDTRDGMALHFPQVNLHDTTTMPASTPAQRMLALCCALITGLLVVGVTMTATWGLQTFIIATSLITLGSIAAIDCQHLLCPDQLSLPLVALGLWYHVNGYGSISVSDAFYGMVAGYLFFRAIAFLYRLIRHRDGLGGGDAKLLAIAGAWLGWQALPAVVAIAATAGCVVGGALLYRRHIQAHTPLPFGPFIIAAALFVAYSL